MNELYDAILYKIVDDVISDMGNIQSKVTQNKDLSPEFSSSQHNKDRIKNSQKDLQDNVYMQQMVSKEMNISTANRPCQTTHESLHGSNYADLMLSSILPEADGTVQLTANIMESFSKNDRLKDLKENNFECIGTSTSIETKLPMLDISTEYGQIQETLLKILEQVSSHSYISNNCEGSKIQIQTHVCQRSSEMSSIHALSSHIDMLLDEVVKCAFCEVLALEKKLSVCTNSPHDLLTNACIYKDKQLMINSVNIEEAIQTSEIPCELAMGNEQAKKVKATTIISSAKSTKAETNSTNSDGDILLECTAPAEPYCVILGQKDMKKIRTDQNPLLAEHDEQSMLNVEATVELLLNELLCIITEKVIEVPVQAKVSANYQNIRIPKIFNSKTLHDTENILPVKEKLMSITSGSDLFIVSVQKIAEVMTSKIIIASKEQFLEEQLTRAVEDVLNAILPKIELDQVLDHVAGSCSQHFFPSAYSKNTLHTDVSQDTSYLGNISMNLVKSQHSMQPKDCNMTDPSIIAPTHHTTSDNAISVSQSAFGLGERNEHNKKCSSGSEKLQKVLVSVEVDNDSDTIILSKQPSLSCCVNDEQSTLTYESNAVQNSVNLVPCASLGKFGSGSEEELYRLQQYEKFDEFSIEVSDTKKTPEIGITEGKSLFDKNMVGMEHSIMDSISEPMSGIVTDQCASPVHSQNLSGAIGVITDDETNSKNKVFELIPVPQIHLIKNEPEIILDSSNRFCVPHKVEYNGIEVDAIISEIPSNEDLTKWSKSHILDDGGVLNQCSNCSNHLRESRMALKGCHLLMQKQLDELKGLKWKLKDSTTVQASSLSSNSLPYNQPALLTQPRNDFNDIAAVCADPSIEELKDALVQMEEKYRQAMVQTAQLDNERSQLQYQTQQLRDVLEEQEDELYRLKGELKEKSQKLEQQKRAYGSLQKKCIDLQEALDQRDELIQDLEIKQETYNKLSTEVYGVNETVFWKDKKIKALMRQIKSFERLKHNHEQGLVVIGENKETLDGTSRVDGSYSKPGLALVSQQAAQVLESAGDGSLDAQLKRLAEEKQDLLDQVGRLQRELDDEKRKEIVNGLNEAGHSDSGLSEMQILEIQREGNKLVNEYKVKLQQTEQDNVACLGHISRLESQLQRHKQISETYEKNEDELRAEKRKLMRDLRTALDRIEEMEMTNSHLEKRLERIRASRTTVSQT